MKRIVSLTALIILICTTTVGAQSTGYSTGSTGYGNGSTQGSGNTQYNSAGGYGGNSFGGAIFNAVGSGALGCAKSAAVQGLTSLTTSLIGKSVKKEVPVGDATLKNAKTCLDGAAYSIAKSMLKDLSNKTLNWVNTGFGGNPLYVQDTGSFMKNISNKEISSFLSGVQNSNPVFGNALRSSLTQQITGKSDGLIDKQMNTPEAKKYQAFMQDFTQGGWGAWLDTTQHDNNNPIGAVFNSIDKVGSKIEKEQQKVTDEIQRNNGFLDMKECVEKSDGKPKNTYPYRYGTDMCKIDYKAEKESALATCNEKLGAERTKCKSDVETDITTKVTKNCVPYMVEAKVKEGTCLTSRTVTPGSLVAEQIFGTTKLTQDQLALADSMNETLSNFFTALVDNLFNKGLGLLSRSTSQTTGYGSYNTVLGSNGLPITIRSVGMGSAGASGVEQDFDISRPQLVDGVLKAQLDFLNRSYDARIALARIIPTMGRLDHVFPGPNPTWQEGLGANVNTYIGTLMASANRGFLSAMHIKGRPSLYDKTTGEELPGSDHDWYAKNTSTADPLAERLQAFANDITTSIQQRFTKQNLMDAYAALAPTQAEKARAEGFVEDVFEETKDLPSYSMGMAEVDSQYEQNAIDTRRAIRELTDIRKSVNEIVGKAKVRYIKERAANGDPVDMACIDVAYKINLNDLVGVARKESDTPKPIVQQSAMSKAYFYSLLNSGI